MISVFLAIAAFTFSEVLTVPGMILGKTYDYLENKLPEWFFKPLIGCSKCVAGQWALWGFFFLTEYNFFLHVWFILQSIFNVSIIRVLYYRITNDQFR